MTFSFEVVLHNLPYLIGAARWTLLISITGIVLAIVLGTVICAARIGTSKPLRLLSGFYISAFRGVPLLVQLLLFYYLLPRIGLDLPATPAAILAVGMCSAAYVAEIQRSALQSIPSGQTEAAEALGISPFALWRRILIPQALRLGLPSLINELILLVKVSSLASVVGIGELTRVAQNITGQTYRPLEIYITAALIYFVINFTLSQIGRYAERRLKFD